MQPYRRAEGARTGHPRAPEPLNEPAAGAGARRDRPARLGDLKPQTFDGIGSYALVGADTVKASAGGTASFRVQSDNGATAPVNFTAGQTTAVGTVPAVNPGGPAAFARGSFTTVANDTLLSDDFYQ